MLGLPDARLGEMVCAVVLPALGAVQVLLYAGGVITVVAATARRLSRMGKSGRGTP